MRKIVLLAFAVMLLVTGCNPESSNDKPRKQNPPPAPAPPDPQPTTAKPLQPNPKEGDPNPSGWKSVIVLVGAVEKEFLPSQVHAFSRDTEPKEYSDVLTTSNVVEYHFAYDPKKGANIIATISNSTRGSKSTFCSINAGSGGSTGTLHIKEGRAELTCQLWIKPEK